jgi:hydrogenase maturation factor
MSATSTAPTCITCGDVAVAMRVVGVDEGTQMARCITDDGCESDVQIDLVSPVAVGDELLVHAGVALQVLGPGVAR